LQVSLRRSAGKKTGVQQDFHDKATVLHDVVKDVLDESAKSIHADLPFQGGAVRFRLPELRYALRGMLEAAEIESDEGAPVAVSERGTGFQSALVLGILRFVAERESATKGHVFFAVEEPEAFLHPQTQRAMAQILKKLSKTAQVLVTTHSSVVVDSFRISQIARLST
jgi:putative ATP-dependent endonuclease of the OLD family